MEKRIKDFHFGLSFKILKRLLFFGLAIFSTFLFRAEVLADYNTSGTPTIHYNFNDSLGSTQANDTLGANHITLQENAAINVLGKYGNGLKLDGSADYASASDSSDFSQTGSFSLEAWFKTDSVSGTEDTIQTIAAKWDETSDDRSYRLIIQTDSTGRAFPKFQISTDGTSGNIQTVTGTTQIVADKWYQVTGYYNATSPGTISIYINGVEEAQTTSVGTSISDEPSGFYVGATKTGASTYTNYFGGYIDEIRLLSGTREEGSVSQSYEGGRPAAHLTFDDGTGQGAYYEEKRAKKSYWAALVDFPTDDSQWVEGVNTTYGLDFDGSSNWVDLGKHDHLQLGSGITLSAWINPDNLSTNQAIISQPHTNGYTFYITTAGEMVFGAQGGTTATTSGAGITADTWQYVTISYDGSNAYFFKDGRLISSPALSLWSVTSGATLIGKNTTGTPNYFDGTIDEVTIYPYSRTTFEVQIDKNSGTTTLGQAPELKPKNRQKGCPAGYVFVPGDPLFGTDDFCVMKYEAKCDTDLDGIGNNPADGSTCENDGYATYGNNNDASCACTAANGNAVVSTPEGFPLTNIYHDDAVSYCENLGEGYHLLTNDEYMTIARNAEKQAANWCDTVGSYGVYPCGNSPGDSYMASGHNDNSGEAVYGDTSGALEASSNDSYACYRTTDGATTCDDASGKQRRTLMLSNGSIIWDIPGNVWEHVNLDANDNNIYNEADDLLSEQEQPDAWDGTTTESDWGYDWVGFTSDDPVSTYYLENNGSGNFNYDRFRPSNSTYNASDHRVGRIYTNSGSSSTTKNRVVLRGGTWRSSTNGGVFATSLGWHTSYSTNNVGFRCVVNLP